MDILHQTVLTQFQLDAPAVSCEPFGRGHINKTFLVTTAAGGQYLLQKLSNRAFGDIDQLMENLSAVSDYLRKRTDDPRKVLTLIPTVDGKPYYHHETNSDWRVFVFIGDSVCLQAAECPQDFYESAVAFGGFAQQLDGFPAETLHETIPNFHNTPDRYRLFKEALERDAMGRAKDVQAEIAFALAREQEAGVLVAQQQAGVLPLRVTHNDTKLNNVMLDKATRKPLCVIDLDTTMPGLIAYDYGDSIRFGASTAAEDEQDLSKVWMDIILFRAYTEGFLTACPGLTESERKSLPVGAKLMTLECGVRFLTDYLDGDNYFSTQYAQQNLDRCRTQFKLVADMESKWEQMQQIVEEVSAQCSKQ